MTQGGCGCPAPASGSVASCLCQPWARLKLETSAETEDKELMRPLALLSFPKGCVTTALLTWQSPGKYEPHTTE